VLPNGLKREALGQFRAAKVARGELSIAFPIVLRAPGAVVDFLVDDLSIARLDPGRYVRPNAGDDDVSVAIADPKLNVALHTRLGLPVGASLTRGALRRLLWIDLRGLGIHDLAGLEWASNLRVIDVADNPLRAPPDLSKFPHLIRVEPPTRSVHHLS